MVPAASWDDARGIIPLRRVRVGSSPDPIAQPLERRPYHAIGAGDVGEPQSDGDLRVVAPLEPEEERVELLGSEATLCAPQEEAHLDRCGAVLRVLRCVLG